MIRSANQPLLLDEFDDFASSLNVNDMLNGGDNDVFSTLLNDYDPSTAVDYWTAYLDKEEEEGAQTDSSSSQPSPCSVDSGNHSPSSSSCEALNFTDFSVQPTPCPTTAARRQSDVPPRKSVKLQQQRTSTSSAVNFDQHVPQKQQCYRPLQPQQPLQQVVLVLPDANGAGVEQKPNVIPIAPNPAGSVRSTARQQAQPYPTIRPKQIKLEALDPPATPLPQYSRLVATPQPAAIAVHRPVAVRTLSSVDGGCPSTETFTEKREQRKIRNREAAQLSRMRRKEMVDTMKSQLDRCVSENDRLKRENHSLRERVAGLLRENDLLRQQSGFIRTTTVAKTAGVCVMALMMVVTINSGSLLSRFSPQNPSQLMPVRDYELAKIKGRSLLTVEDYDQNFDDSPVNSDSAPVNGTDCRKKYFNQTESIILNNVLSSWVDRHEKLRTGHVRRVKTSTFTKSAVNATIPASNATTATKTKPPTAPVGKPSDSWNHLDLLSGDNMRQQQLKRTRRPSGGERRQFDLQLFSQIEMQYLQLVRALKQRDDTIYLVSMKDYLLLPATGRNSTERPRLTLVVPALSFNGGSSPDQVAMMRIECEVVGTGLLHLPETLFPSFLNQTLF